VLQLVDSPWCEHNPGQDGVDKKDEGISNTSGDTKNRKPGTSFTGSFEAGLPVTTLPTHATYCRARSRTATAGCEAHDLFGLAPLSKAQD
jgi:hypothetical protein